MKIKAISPNVLSYARSKKWWERRNIEFLIDLEFWIRQRWHDLRNFVVGRYNVVKIDALKRTQYVDSDTVLFEAMFQILKDYVEIECAHMHNLSMVGKHPRRDPEAGLAQLEWEIQQGDDSPEQSEAAKEIKELYLWYTKIRTERNDPWDILPESGITWESVEGRISKEERGSNPEYTRLLKLAAQAEADQYQEDTDMMVRLCKVRQMMWT